MQVPDKHGMHKYTDTHIHTHPSTHPHTHTHIHTLSHTHTHAHIHTQSPHAYKHSRECIHKTNILMIYSSSTSYGQGQTSRQHQIVVQLADTLIMRYQLYLNILCAWRYVRAWNTLLNLQGKGGDTKGLIPKGTYFNHRNNGVRTLAGNCVDPLPPPLRGKREQPCAHISWRIPSDTQLLHPPGRSIRVAAA